LISGIFKKPNYGRRRASPIDVGALYAAGVAHPLCVGGCDSIFSDAFCCRGCFLFSSPALRMGSFSITKHRLFY